MPLKLFLLLATIINHHQCHIPGETVELKAIIKDLSHV